MSKKPTEKELEKAIQDLGAASRKYRDSLKAKYASFLGWIGESHSPMEVVMRILRTFKESDILAIGDDKLAELYVKSQIVYDYQKKGTKK